MSPPLFSNSPALDPSRAMDPGASGGGGAGSLGSHRRVVRWERFLPRRSLRVLLVEHDDCTRNIVTVLLHKCSYHVCAVADGIKAWEVLKEREYKVDLVLAEVAMSGVGLLAKITATEECRNIPVIMMSSQDSIGVVLKCMLKGAADFLVKPVRKNELQNLWQHVWRRHCSSNYANASENNANASENNAASNHVSANGNDRSKTGEDSEEEPNAQSSDSKPSTEVESIMKHIECPVADVRSLSREEVALEQTDNNNDVLVSLSKMDDGGETRGCPSNFQHVDSEAQIDAGSAHANIATETELKLARPLHESTISDKVQEQNCSYDRPPYRMESLGYMRTRENYDNDARLYYQNKADSVEPTTNEQDSSHVIRNDALKQDAAHMQNTSDFGSSPLLELFLRRPQPNACTLQQSKERVILNHCNSAFSRYGDKRILISSEKLVSSGSGIRPREYGDSSQSHACNHDTENGSYAPITPKERLPSHQRNVSHPSSHLQASSQTNKVDEVPLLSDLPMEDACAGHPSTGEEAVFRYPPFGFIPLPLPFGAAPYQGLCAGYGAILQPMFYQEASISPNDSAAVEKETNQIGCEKPVHYDNHFSNPSRSNKFNDNEETESHHRRQLLDMDRQDPREACTPMEHAYQSGSCSQNILRGRGGSGSGETTDARAALESGNESGIRNCTFKGLREAALMKFRLKRKDRCFEKKVRYHSRKKLAEQRPRVKGQFVRQKILDPTAEYEAGE